MLAKNSGHDITLYALNTKFRSIDRRMTQIHKSTGRYFPSVRLEPILTSNALIIVAIISIYFEKYNDPSKKQIIPSSYIKMAIFAFVHSRVQ